MARVQTVGGEVLFKCAVHLQEREFLCFGNNLTIYADGKNLGNNSRSGRVRLSSCAGTSPNHMPLLRLSCGRLSFLSWPPNSLHKYTIVLLVRYVFE